MRNLTILASAALAVSSSEPVYAELTTVSATENAIAASGEDTYSSSATPPVASPTLTSPSYTAAESTSPTPLTPLPNYQSK